MYSAFCCMKGVQRDEVRLTPRIPRGNRASGKLEAKPHNTRDSEAALQPSLDGTTISSLHAGKKLFQLL